MNWYKTARLADAESDPDKHIFTTCQYCKRWVAEGAPRIWKKEEELDHEENDQRQFAEDMMLVYPSGVGVSHGICSYCSEVLETVGFPSNKDDIANITKMSLMMS